jgi:hypothetical protein
VLIDTVFYLVAVTARLPLLRAIPFHVNVDVDLDYLVRCKKTVPDALFQGI